MVKSIENNFGYAKSLIGKPRTCLEVISHHIHVPLPPEYLSDVKNAVLVVLRDELKIYSPELNGVPVAFNEKSARLSESYGTYIGSQPYVHCDVECEFIVFKPKVGDLLEGTVNKCTDTQIACVIHGCFFGTIHKKKSQHQKVKVGDKITVRVTRLDEDGDGILSLKCSLAGEPQESTPTSVVAKHIEETIDGIVFYASKTADEGDAILPSVLLPQTLFSDCGSMSDSLLSPVRQKSSKKIKHPSEYIDGGSTANESESTEATQGSLPSIMKSPAKDEKKRKRKGREKQKKNSSESHTSDTDATTATTLSFSSHLQRLASPSENFTESTQSQQSTVAWNTSPHLDVATDPSAKQEVTILPNVRDGKILDIKKGLTPKELSSPVPKSAKKRKTGTAQTPQEPSKKMKGAIEPSEDTRNLAESLFSDGQESEKENPNMSLQDWLDTAPGLPIQKVTSQPLKWTSCDSIEVKQPASLTPGETNTVCSASSLQSKGEKKKKKKSKEKKQKKEKHAKKDRSKPTEDYESVFLSPPKVQLKQEVATGKFPPIVPTQPDVDRPQNGSHAEEEHRRQALFHLQKIGINLPLHLLAGSLGQQAVTSTAATVMSPIVTSSAVPNAGPAVSSSTWNPAKTSTPFVAPRVEAPAGAALFTYDKLHGINIAGGKSPKIRKKKKKKKDKKSLKCNGDPLSSSMNDSGLDSLPPTSLIAPTATAAVPSLKSKNSCDSGHKRGKKKEKKKKKEKMMKSKQKDKKRSREKKEKTELAKT